MDASLRALSVGYAAAVDGLDGAAFASLFLTDGELWVPDASRGPVPAIRRAGHGALVQIPSGLSRYHATYHRVADAGYDVNGDSATGVVIGVAHHLAPRPGSGGGGEGTDTIWYLRYVDDYRRGADGWRIARRALHLRGIEKRPVTHLGPGR